MPDGTNTSQCTIDLLLIAAEASYRVREGNLIDVGNAIHMKTLHEIWAHGYEIADAISPKSSKGTGDTPVAAVTLTPQDPTAPIIISFRGTKTLGDVSSDIHLGTLGVVGKRFRHAAFAYYENVRKEYPGREIVLTGHSLGGHLAQYVGIKACNEATKPQSPGEKLPSNPPVQVRTFNTAPVSTRHSEVFKTHPELKEQFVNYRLSADVVSNLALQKYTGDTFVFHCDKTALVAHQLGTVRTDLPDDIKAQPVGSTKDASYQHNRLVELIDGVHDSYQCYVKGLLFSRFREERKDLAKMDAELPLLHAYLKVKNYDQAILFLNALKDELVGNKAKDMVGALITSAQAVKAMQPKSDLAASPPPPPAVSEDQKSMKSAVADMRQQARSSELQKMPDSESSAKSHNTPKT